MERCDFVSVMAIIRSYISENWGLNQIDFLYLIEMGFITPLPGHCVSLHPMIQETSLADLKPSITNCRVLLENLHSICLFHGREVSYYKVMFQTIENIIHFIEKDELPFYRKRQHMYSFQPEPETYY